MVLVVRQYVGFAPPVVQVLGHEALSKPSVKIVETETGPESAVVEASCLAACEPCLVAWHASQVLFHVPSASTFSSWQATHLSL